MASRYDSTDEPSASPDASGVTRDTQRAKGGESRAAATQSVADRARSARPMRKTATATGSGTSRARGRRPAAARPTGPVQFGRESVDELKKVVWPTWPTVQQFFWAVLVFVLIVIAYVGLLDLGFGWLLLQLLG